MRAEPSFGQWLKTRRKVLDLTQRELAGRIGCAVITVQKIEAGRRRPSKQLAGLLAAQLGIPAEEQPEFVRFARAGGNPQWSATVPQAPGRFSWPPSPHPRTNLPAEPTPLIGRDRDVAAVRRRLLEDDGRLLTLVGAPGVGKTRLAVRVAANLLDDFTHGVKYVCLAPVSDPTQVPAAVAQTLEVNRVADRSFASRLKEYLHDKHILLVLDNFEQVVTAGLFVDALVAACPWLSVLVTSRMPLNCRRERQFRVRPLGLPEGLDDGLGPADLMDYPAISLFVERARTVKPELALTTENAAAIASICARLDGLPLAIELVAARISVLPPQALREQLCGELILETAGPRDLAERHRTLRDAIDWSFALLTPGEQQLLTRLGVFVGGWTTETAAQVAGDIGDGSSPASLDRLTSLVNSSLVVQQDHGGLPRFTLLETIREYTLEQMSQRGEKEMVERRHAETYLALAEKADPHLRTFAQDEWLERLETEKGNLRAALAWFSERTSDADVEAGLRLVAALSWFWTIRGYLSEGRHWANQCLQRGSSSPPALRARVMSSAGSFAWQQGDLTNAHTLLQESIALYRELDVAQGWDLVLALSGRGMVAAYQADHDTARAVAEESVAFSRQIDDKWCLALSLNPIGEAHLLRRDYAAAASCFEESLTLFRETGDRWGMGVPLLNWGYLASIQGDYEMARLQLEESIAMHRAVGERWQRALSLNVLAQVALEQGDHREATALHDESLDLLAKMGLEANAAEVLFNLAYMVQSQGHSSLAARLYKECLVLFTSQGIEEGIARCRVGLAAVGSQSEK